MKIKKVLIANRGEVVERVARSLKKMGIVSTTLRAQGDRISYSDNIDECIALPESGVAAYLNISAIVELAKKHNCDAIHPGWGFLSENADFAQAVRNAKLIFIGPSAKNVADMGNKVEAKKLAKAFALPVLESVAISEASSTQQALTSCQKRLTLPIFLKPAMGGGGKGMLKIEKWEDFERSLLETRTLSKQLFGSGEITVEPYISNAYHIEVQVVSDASGNHFHLFERDCSIQRRSQKLIEEAPSPKLSPKLRKELCASAVKLTASLNYQNLGTVEYLFDGHENFYFMEMNTRLQVEHGVTEELLGLDLVALQIKIAEGQSLDFSDLSLPKKHAIEVRVCAENPLNGFLPSGGKILKQHLNPNTRNDCIELEGLQIESEFDSMFLKVLCDAPTRHEAISKLDQALERTKVLGLHHNLNLLRWMLTHSDFQAAQHHTQWLEKSIHQHADFMESKSPDSASLEADYQDYLSSGASSIDKVWQAPDEMHSHSLKAVFAEDLHNLWAWQQGWHHVSKKTAFLSRASEGAGQNELLAPMTGKIKSINCKAGDVVEADQALLSLEAMKMEHLLRAPTKMKVKRLHCAEGEQVELDEVLIELEAL